MDSDLDTALTAIQGQRMEGALSARWSGVSIDSRTVRPGELFFCIEGERFDSHDFVEDVIARGAAGVIASNKDKLPMARIRAENRFAVLVPDTLRALQDLAAYHRNQHNLRVVGVTGTNGKSTTKEMIAGIAAARFRTLKSRGNLNNHIGLPLNVLDLAPEHEVAVLEMGMSALGEIRRLAEIARPQIGVITNISEAHMVHLKTVQEVQSAKGELFEALPDDGIAVVNADDPLVRDLARNLRARVITFGLDPTADVQARDLRPAQTAGFDFTAKVFDAAIPVHLPFPGAFNVSNALAAMAVGAALEIPAEEMAAALETTHGLAQRGEVTRHAGMTLLNDTYNANPRSMQEAIKTLSALPCTGRRFLVIGDMLELGEQETAAHQRIGEIAAELDIDYLVTVGRLAGLAGETALQKGIDAARVACTDTHEQAADFLKQHARAGDCLLFKGSRGSRMETVMERFTGAAR